MDSNFVHTEVRSYLR